MIRSNVFSGKALLSAAILFACLAAAPVGHATPDEDASICRGLMQHIDRAMPARKTPQLLHSNKLYALSNTGDGFIQSIGGPNPSDDELAKRMLDRLPEADREAFNNPTGNIEWRSFGHSIAVAQIHDNGAFNCSTFRFFDISGDGEAKAIDIEKHGLEDGYEVCPREDGRHAYTVAIGGKPTLVEDQDLGTTENVSLVVRDNGAWHEFCPLQIKWKPTYQVIERYCDGPQCDDFAAAALDIARAYDPHLDLSAYWAKIPKVATPAAHKKRLEGCLYDNQSLCRPPRWKPASADSDHWTIMLGGQPTTIVRLEKRTYAEITGATDANTKSAQLNWKPAPDGSKKPNDPDLDFRNGSEIAPIEIAGATYLTRIANFPQPGSTAAFDAYEVGLYRPAKAGLEAVAGFVVVQNRLPHPSIRQISSEEGKPRIDLKPVAGQTRRTRKSNP